ncbi:hypothetical protein HYH02_001753 [Chlamydomonas schloesseri]|uniref:Plastid lipid-associated protein/fibrillin conserved domain-containing protein n=1 Tax=Chlamydomonas schloesseri TaxID=2026947 RepID=A0A836BC76_9CHLO|nr:hypothetical protein HYH02_001753 [Chlamydomonas schloesseri]|eukprot:KAG2453534.1 hypothetical protein HYH02_001753 [Chlamydomonas schloesseri]
MHSPLSPPGLGTQRSPIVRGRGNRKHVAGVVGAGPISPLRLSKHPIILSPTHGGRSARTAATGPGGEGTAGLDIAALFRKVLSNGVQDDGPAAAAASAADAYTHASPPPPPPGPFASAASSAFSGVSAAAAAGGGGGGGSPGAQPLASLAEQVLSGAGTGHGEDPVAAARQLQAFLSQYQHQYGPETDARIGAAVAKLQDYIDGAGTGGSAAGLREALGAFGAADASASAAAAAGAAGADAAPVYHNYILEQLTGVLDWVNNLLVRNGTPKPFVYDAYGRVVEGAGAAAAAGGAASVEQQQEQLRAASQSLRLLIQQLQQVNTQYAAMADSEERATMGQVLNQLTTMADRLAVAATRRPLPPLEAPLDVAPYVAPEQVHELYGVDKYRDPLLRVLDGIYSAVVVDSGLREFLAGVKQLGDSLAASMSVAWTGAPPVGRLVAYIAAVAGVLFVMRSKLPKALLQPTSPGGGWLRQLGGGRGADGGGGADADAGGSSSSTSSLSTSTFGSMDWAEGGAQGGRAPASAGGGGGGGGLFASAAGGGSARTAQARLSAMDRDGGLGDTRLASEILASGDPYAARKVLFDTTATTAGQAGIAGGQAAAVAAAARQRGATAVAQPPPPVPLGGNGAGQYSAGGSIPSLPKPPPGGWNSSYSDRVDWWTAGQTAQQPQQPSTTPPPPPPPQPRTVAESWEAFRRSTGGLGADTAAAASSSSSASYSSVANPAGGVLDATAALAAAAVAAAVGGNAAGAAGRGGGAAAGSSDPKMAEFSRATEERRIGRDRARLRETIKDRLRWVVRALGPVTSVVPGGEPLREEVDGLLAQLEALSPTDRPLNTAVDGGGGAAYGGGGYGGGGYGMARMAGAAVDPNLLGEWRLVYASNAGSAAGAPSAASQAASGGPNLLAQVLQLADSLPGFGMTHVLQRLSLEEQSQPAGGGGAAAPSYASSGASYGGSGGSGRSGGSSAAAAAAAAVVVVVVVTENSAVFRFGPLGSWRVTVKGRWVDNGGGMCAAAEFESFSVRPVDLWGLSVETLLPEVTVPVPEILRSRSEWCTTYLDEDMRVGRGSGGALFLFRRGGAEDAPEAAGVGAGLGVGAGTMAADPRGTPAMRPL